MAHVVLDRVEVVSFLPQQNADAVLQNVIVPFGWMNAREGSISFDDNVHVLARPRKQFGLRASLGEFQQGRLVEQGIAVNSQSVQSRAALLQPLD